MEAAFLPALLKARCETGSALLCLHSMVSEIMGLASVQEGEEIDFTSQWGQ